MPLLIPPGYAQAVYRFSLIGDAEPIVITCGHDVTATPASDGELIANRLFTNFSTAMIGQLNSRYWFEGVTLYFGDATGPGLIFDSTNARVQGTNVTPPLPQNCAFLIRKKTGSAGRRGRGRMYFPGPAEGQVNELGVIDGAALTSLQNSVNTWYGWMTGVPAGSVAYPPVVLHRSEGAGVEPPPTEVTVLEVDSRIATQRQRLRR